MKNQYFGDINDYRKYGLLRSVLAASRMSLFVAWMLTEDDGSSDGGRIDLSARTRALVALRPRAI